MRSLKDMTRGELEDLVILVVEALWTEDMELSSCRTKLGFAPEHEWSPDELDIIGQAFSDVGLRPDAPATPIEGFEQYEAWKKTATPA